MPTHQEPVFFEHVNRVYPSETTENYVNRVVFEILKYVKTCGDPIAMNGGTDLKIGYIRVSTEEQNTARQEVLLRELGVDEVFIEKASGKNADRPELTRMMEYVRRGDTVIVESISRFARNTRDLLDLVERLTEKHVEFVSRKEAIDTTNVSTSCSVSARASPLLKNRANTPAASQCPCRTTSSGWLLAGVQERLPPSRLCGRRDLNRIPFTAGALTNIKTTDSEKTGEIGEYPDF